MKHLVFTVLLALAWSGAWAQSPPIDSLFRRDEYAAVVKYEGQAAQLSPIQLFQLGFSFYQLNEYAKAVAFCDRARDKGLQSPVVPFVKGMALRALGDLSRAAAELETACKGNPQDADYHVELAKTQLRLQRPNQAIRTLQQLTARNPTAYEAQQMLLRLCNQQGRAAAADSAFQQLRGAYLAGQLPPNMMKPRNVMVHSFEWRGQPITVSRYYEAPKEALKPLYRIMLFDKAGESVERSLVVERTHLANDPKPQYSLAERGLGNSLHRSYGQYWNTEAIPLDELQRAVSHVLDETYVPGERSGPDKDKGQK